MLLPEEFYVDSDVVNLAKVLLGKTISTYTDGIMTSGMIVETEAYRGPDDRGCHAFGNRYTERTKTMFESGGVAYVYICYGLHPMFNVVSGAKDQPHAILVRAIEPFEGIDTMLQRRNLQKLSYQLSNGPGKAAVALGITKNLDGSILFDQNSPIQITENQINLKDEKIVTGLRVGMSVHVGLCAYRPWRFYIKDNPWVSKPLVVRYDF